MCKEIQIQPKEHLKTVELQLHYTILNKITPMGKCDFVKLSTLM